MRVTRTLSFLAFVLATGLVLCLADQEVASELRSHPAAAINYNQNDLHNQDFSATTTRINDSHDSVYTRSRSLLFTQEYVHVDVSDRFSNHGKTFVSVMFLVFWALPIFFKKRRATIRLVGAVLMIGLRHIMLKSGDGPVFYLDRVFFWKPLMIQFGLMLTTIGLEKTEHGGLVQKIGNMLDDPVSWKRCRNILFLSTLGSAVLSQELNVFLFSGVVADLCIRHNVVNPMPYLLSLSTAANIGSALTLNGTFANLMISTLSYDILSWQEFAKNLFLPTIASSIINFILIMLFYCSELFSGSRGGEDSFRAAQEYEMVGRNDADEECHVRPCEYVAAGDMPPPQWSLWSILQLGCIGIYMICFAMGLDLAMVSIGAGVCLMVLHLGNRMYYQGGADIFQGGSAALVSNANEGNQVATTRIPLDYGILMTQLAQFILVGSLNDTGVPQATFNMSMGTCAEQMVNGSCLYRFIAVIAPLSTIFSSASAVQMCAATFPYASPYDWVQVSFAVNMAGNLAVYGSSTHYTAGDQFASTSGKPSPVSFGSYVIFGMVSGTLSLFVGARLLAIFHSAFECSVRLGEC